MGMGYSSGYADTVKDEFVMETCPVEYRAFRLAIDDDKNADTASVARAAAYDGVKDEFPGAIANAYGNLCSAFAAKTGLSLGLSFHDQESEGDRYDELDGTYWYVEGAYALTPAGEKYKGWITRQHFVNFG